MSMPGYFKKLYGRVLPGAIALLLAVSPMTGLTAYASNGGGGDAAGEGAGAHKYVISNKNSDPDYRHDENCRQDIDGVSVGPGDAAWPTRVYDEDLDGEFTGHHDGLCYKTFIDNPELERPAKDPAVQEPEGDPAEQEPEKDKFKHGADCMHKHDLICDDTSESHEHDEDCYGPGNVDKHGWEHDDTCIKAPYKPGIESMALVMKAVATAEQQDADSEGELIKYVIRWLRRDKWGVLEEIRLPETRQGHIGELVVLSDEDRCVDGYIENPVLSDGYRETEWFKLVDPENENTEIKLVFDPVEPLPATGGAGTAMWLCLGVSGLLAGCAVLFAMRRRDA